MTLPVRIGDVVGGKLVVERLLGRGGMGAVFVARQTQLDRRVAIKVLLPGVAANEQALARFDREARAAAALHSDHVARILDFGHLDSGSPYIVMELLEGEDLSDALARRGPLPSSEVVGAVLQACDALDEAHGLGIVHRDLKPANVFLASRPNGTRTVKLLDFGISKSPTSEGASLTASKTIVGSPLYMSPEQLREAKNVDGRTDIWALGATMYELLTGVPPFNADVLAEICALVLHTEPVPVRVHRPDVSPELDAVVLRCLRKDPAERFASVRDLVAALRAVRVSSEAPATTSPMAASPAIDETVLSEAPANAARPRPFEPVASPVATMASSEQGAALNVVGAPAAPSRSRLVALGAVTVLVVVGGGVWALRSSRGAPLTQASSPPAILVAPPPATTAEPAPPPAPPALIVPDPSVRAAPGPAHVATKPASRPALRATPSPPAVAASTPPPQVAPPAPAPTAASDSDPFSKLKPK